MSEEKVEAVRWKVLEGKTVELYFEDTVYRRVDAFLIETKSKQTDKVIDIIAKGKPKYPPIIKKGDWLKDSISKSIFEDHQFKIRSGVVDGLKEFVSTGFRTRSQVVEWVEVSLGLKHNSALIYSHYYTHYLDANNKIETQVIDFEEAYRLREVRAETKTI